MGASHPHAFLFLFFQASSKASLPFFTATKTKTLFALNLQCHTPKQICKCYLASILPLQLNGNHFSSSSLTTACSCTILVQIQRLEASETSWPARRALVACASVCKLWREITKDVVKTPEQCGFITFPISLKQVIFTLLTISSYVIYIYTLFIQVWKDMVLICYYFCIFFLCADPFCLYQPGPRDSPIQCFIRRERMTSTYCLYLGLSPGNFLYSHNLFSTWKQFCQNFSKILGFFFESRIRFWMLDHHPP